MAKFLLTPLREGRRKQLFHVVPLINFYSRPCGRGDVKQDGAFAGYAISTHAPAGGATYAEWAGWKKKNDFYSRPCGRGDVRE